MGWTSYNLRPGETLAAFVRRDCPNTEFSDIREISNSCVATVIEGDFWGADWFAPCADGKIRVAGIVKFEGGYVKYIEEVSGPLGHPAFPADMLATLSPLANGTGKGWCAKWRASQQQLERA